jgi:hypothetical protein
MASSSRSWQARTAMKNLNSVRRPSHTHQIPMTEASEEKVEIIAILYTVNSKLNTAIFADSSRIKASLLGIEDRLIVQNEVCSFCKKLRRSDKL